MRQLTAGQQLACDRRVKQDRGLFILEFKKQKNMESTVCEIVGYSAERKHQANGIFGCRPKLASFSRNDDQIGGGFWCGARTGNALLLNNGKATLLDRADKRFFAVIGYVNLIPAAAALQTGVLAPA